MPVYTFTVGRIHTNQVSVTGESQRDALNHVRATLPKDAFIVSIGTPRTIPWHNRLTVQVARALSLAAGAFGLTVDELANTEDYEAALPRYVAAWLLQRHTALPLTRIAAFLARDRSTIMYGLQRVDTVVKADPEMAALVENLSRQMQTLTETERRS